MKKRVLLFIFIFLLNLFNNTINAENGYNLWLRYEHLNDPNRLEEIHKQITGIYTIDSTTTLNIACKEIKQAMLNMTGKELNKSHEIDQNGLIVLVNINKSGNILNSDQLKKLPGLKKDGFIIKKTKLNNHNIILVAANSDVGVLYGSFSLLREIQTNSIDFENLNIISVPDIKLRLLNHWDNLDRTVERGYAGFSIWDWHRLPGYIDERYTDYARANASIGINGTVLTNVNANSHILTDSYLQKVSALADVFRPYGIKVYLTARFSAPIEIGGLPTADPLNEKVIAWWQNKVDQIYNLIPDFGGFLVKANSEGQPGPQKYGRNHAQGANMLARAIGERGIVMWRAFVYDDNVPEDRAKQAYTEFKPLDGKFEKNVLVQIKNGAIDFQPREPFHPLFGAMPKTPQMMEFQITLEYLGQGTHLTYLAPLFKECLESDTYVKGEGSTVAKIISGELENKELTGMAGVSNIGNDINWTGHLFGQSNWYAYGRLAWNMNLSSSEIAKEWVKLTFGDNEYMVNTISEIMLKSREIVVNYMTPLGLHHQMGAGHHYGPGPWVELSRADWSSTYYHKADKKGLGFDRTKKGSDAVSQYYEPVASQFNNINECPEKYLLWFHHVAWDYPINSDHNLWEELCNRFYAGADSVLWMIGEWEKLENHIDAERFNRVKMLLEVQYKEAIWWRDAMVLYFQQFSKKPLPEGLEKPIHNLEYYKQLEFPYAPGN